MTDANIPARAVASQQTSAVAVLVPCFNEAAQVAAVIRDFANALPGASIYVYDNNSADGTADIARQAGAVVRYEPLQGKGNVVRRMFADVDADVYVLVDGDGTYDAASAPQLIEKLQLEQLDMVNATRVAQSDAAFRIGHRFGNRVLTGLVTSIFGKQISDMLSGYRVMSRRFVKSFPALAAGFEIETELTVHALELRIPIAEVATPYRERPIGSSSKLRPIHDGVRILRTIVALVREERPFKFFMAIALSLALLSFLLGESVVAEYVRTGLVPRLPTAVLATGIMILAFLSGVCGLILDTVTRGRKEMKRLMYLLADSRQ